MMFQSIYKYLFFIAIVGVLSAIFHGLGVLDILPWHLAYSDVAPFYEQAVKPGIPYIDKTVEYPVLTGFFIHAMGMIGGSKMGYYVASSFFLILCAGITTFFLYRLAQERGYEKRLLWFWIFAPSMLVFMIYNWDVIAIMFVVAAFYCMQRQKDYAAASLLALGFSAKFFPILYLAPLILARWRLSQTRFLVTQTVQSSNLSHATMPKTWFWTGQSLLLYTFLLASIFLIVVLVVNGIFMIANFDAWSYFFTFNSARSANPDSIWTVAQYLFGIFDISTINTLSLILFAVSYGIFLWFFRKKDFVFLSFGATLLFLLFNKVFSPQYLLWLLPFFVLLPVKKYWFYPLEFANLAALFSILAWFFLADENIYLYLTMYFVTLRHLALLSVFTHLVLSAKNG
ncbi:MAG: hypothetical protein AAB604_01130 [Patescibacteria group bacterium]